MRSERARRGRQGGFVLPATLVVVAIAALVLMAASDWVAGTAETARKLRDRSEAEAFLHGQQQELLFRTLTNDLQVGGLVQAPPQATTGGDAAALAPMIRVDGRPYAQGTGKVALFDLAGLVGLNAVSEEALLRLLEGLGVAKGRRQPMVDALLDYTDDDPLVRPYGAEESDYLRAKLPPPSNSPLRAVGEARRVLGWDDPALFAPDALPSLATVARVYGTNLNAAPGTVLALLLGLEPDGVSKVLEFRRANLFESAENLLAVAGGGRVTTSVEFRYFPSDQLRLTAWDRSGRMAADLEVWLTPFSTTAPFRVLGKTLRPATGHDDLDAPTLRLPDLRPPGPAP